MSRIYFPITANILTPGHIKCLEYLRRKGKVYAGLLTGNALKGYKKELMPYEDRLYVLETIAMALGGIEIVAQETLDPFLNIKKYQCDALASGDGFEKVELRALKKLKLTQIDIKLKGEKEKRYSSSKILNP